MEQPTAVVTGADANLHSQPVVADASSSSKHFIVEHLDPHLEKWSTLEYAAIASECATTPPAGSAVFVLSGVSPSLTLPAALHDANGLRVEKHTIEQLCSEGDNAAPTGGWRKSRVCLMDPKAADDLSPSDAALFDAFLFGGILGDDPPQDRTGVLRKLGFPTRRLGPKQMTTDTAARVVRHVICKGISLERMQWVDDPIIKVDAVEHITMPFRYIRGTNGEPVMPDGMLELIKEDSNQELEIGELM